MMLMKLFTLLLLAATAQTDVFKKEMAPLQASVDGLVTSTGAQVLQRPRAAYIEGYGVLISLEIAFEGSPGIFGTPKKPAEVRAIVSQRRKDVQEKLTAFVKQRVGTMDSIGSSDSLAIVIHVLNTTPTDIPNLPVQIVMSAKKDSPQQVAFREF
jgi:hypothetical protein